MILQYRTTIDSKKVRFLHREDFRAPEIGECIISWECRIPLKEDGITEIYIAIKKVELTYKRYLGNPNNGEEILLSQEITKETFQKQHHQTIDCRTRFIDRRPTPCIKPVEIWVEYSDTIEENIVTLIEFSK